MRTRLAKDNLGGVGIDFLYRKIIRQFFFSAANPCLGTQLNNDLNPAVPGYFESIIPNTQAVPSGSYLHLTCTRDPTTNDYREYQESGEFY